MDRHAFKLQLPRPALRKWLAQGLSQLVDQVRGRPLRSDVARLGTEVQRLRSQAWRSIAARWPALAELVRERKLAHARRRPAAPGASETQLGPAEIDALIAQLMAAEEWQVRADVAARLGHVRGDGVVAALVRALRDPSAEVGVAVVDALASHRDPESTGALLEVLGNRDGFFSPVTRVAAIAALSRRLRADELAPIVAAVRDLDAEVSIAAIAVLAERAPALAQQHLEPILRDRSGYFLPMVRLATANALERAGRLHEPLAVELLASESDPAVRRVLERARNFAVHDPSTLA